MDTLKIYNEKREFIEVVERKDKGVHSSSLDLIDILGSLRIIFLTSSLLFKICFQNPNYQQCCVKKVVYHGFSNPDTILLWTYIYIWKLTLSLNDLRNGIILYK